MTPSFLRSVTGNAKKKYAVPRFEPRDYRHFAETKNCRTIVKPYVRNPRGRMGRAGGFQIVPVGSNPTVRFKL